MLDVLLLASGGVSGVPAELESSSKMLEFVEDQLALETGDAASNDGRIGVFFRIEIRIS
jgi:hypothetical protein